MSDDPYKRLPYTVIQALEQRDRAWVGGLLGQLAEPEPPDAWAPKKRRRHVRPKRKNTEGK